MHRQVEKKYNFSLRRFHPSGVPDLKTWRKKYSSDLYMTDPGRYDQLAKVRLPLELATESPRCYAYGWRSMEYVH